MSSIWFFEDSNLFKVLCPHKFKAYKKDHDFDSYKKSDYIYFEEDASNKVYLIEKGNCVAMNLTYFISDLFIVPFPSLSKIRKASFTSSSLISLVSDIKSRNSCKKST